MNLECCLCGKVIPFTSREGVGHVLHPDGRDLVYCADCWEER